VEKANAAATVERRINIRDGPISELREISRDEHAFDFGNLSGGEQGEAGASVRGGFPATELLLAALA